MDQDQGIDEVKLTNEDIEIIRGLARGMHYFDNEEGDMPLSEIREITQALVDACIKQCGADEFYSPQKDSPSIEPLPIDSFEEMIGRAATEVEKQQIFKLQKILRIKNDDSLWTLILAMQYHMELYNEMPNVIIGAAKQAVANSVAEIREESNAQREKTSNELTKTAGRANRALSSSFDELKKKATGAIATAVEHEIVRLRKQSNRLYISCVVTSLVFLILGATSFLFAGHRIFGG